MYKILIIGQTKNQLFSIIFFYINIIVFFKFINSFKKIFLILLLVSNYISKLKLKNLIGGHRLSLNLIMFK